MILNYLSNKVTTGKMGTCDVFSSKAGNTSYCLIGLGSQNDLNIQIYEMSKECD